MIVRNHSLTLAALVATVLLARDAAAAEFRWVGRQAHRQLVVRTDRLTATIDPAEGGRIASLATNM